MGKRYYDDETVDGVIGTLEAFAKSYTKEAVYHLTGPQRDRVVNACRQFMGSRAVRLTERRVSADLADDVAKFLGRSPYDGPSNLVRDDPYFMASMTQEHGADRVAAEVRRQTRLGPAGTQASRGGPVAGPGSGPAA